MTLQHREALINQFNKKQPTIGGLLNESTGVSLSAGCWDLKSYSFQQGFEAMWDLARPENSHMLDGPLLSLWRQSAELTFKSCIRSITEPPYKEAKLGHDLNKLFQRLLTLSKEAGLAHNDLDLEVEEIIKEVQSFDPFADRFRYPADKKEVPYKSAVFDYDTLFLSHLMIVSWCEGTVAELASEFGIGPDPR